MPTMTPPPISWAELAKLGPGTVFFHMNHMIAAVGNICVVQSVDVQTMWYACLMPVARFDSDTRDLYWHTRRWSTSMNPHPRLDSVDCYLVPNGLAGAVRALRYSYIKQTGKHCNVMV